MASERFRLAIERFDAVNAEDPNHELVDGGLEPKELVYALRMTEGLQCFCPEASLAVFLAVRSQHIR